MKKKKNKNLFWVLFVCDGINLLYSVFLLLLFANQFFSLLILSIILPFLFGAKLYFSLFFPSYFFLLKSVDWHLIFKLTRCIICFCSKYYYYYYDYVILIWKPSLPSFFQCLGKTKYTYLFSLLLLWCLDKSVLVIGQNGWSFT